ncbi:DUF4230 domain-containing protein [Aridibaculum aurantiacum]|uniref:DUF4230 domain-containing protein n=1 Tax=Aridibaculum aurantiacum TaxID=2810307 RepID=UPI001A959019|nr:DUF4230 domain-containing protein [Aridibaculum aurantiacum]
MICLLRMNMRYLIFLLLPFALGCAKREAQQPNVVLAIQEMGDLATVEYTITKIIKANDNKTWYKPGDRKILMTAEAVIKAGVDLTSITENNIRVDGKNITLTLPPPKVVSISMPPEKIQLAYQEVGTFRSEYSTKERDALVTQAEQQIKKSIDSLGILNQARSNTATLMHNLLKQLGFENITINQSGAIQKDVLL